MRPLMRVMFALLTFGMMACSTGGMNQSAVRSMVSNWPDSSQKAAKMAMEKYGLPDEITDSMLVWNHAAGPWKRSMISRVETPHDFPVPHMDVWEQVVEYRVPPEMFDDLAQYDGSVIAERTKGELSARCDKEEANFLAINLADDIIRGRRTVAEARQFYADQIQAMMRGQKGPYLTGLRFVPASMTMTADRDTPATSMISSSPPR